MRRFVSIQEIANNTQKSWLQVRIELIAAGINVSNPEGIDTEEIKSRISQIQGIPVRDINKILAGYGIV